LLAFFFSFQGALPTTALANESAFRQEMRFRHPGFAFARLEPTCSGTPSTEFVLLQRVMHTALVRNSR
jgi:hypothetical protein